MTTKKLRVSTYIEPEVLLKLQALAKLKKRTVSNYLELLIQQSLEEYAKNN